ncbi:MAG: SixA phosphatase family protein [Longimicrobiaceae bacterium]
MIRRIHAFALAALIALPAAAAAQRPTTVILVRHAEKVTANPLDRNPSLSREGRQRARDLAAALRGRRVDAILVTQFKRTRETAVPLAASRGITPEVTQMDGDSDAAAAEVVSRIRARHLGHTVVVVGHSTTVPKIIALLGGPRLRPLCENAYSHLYTLVIPRAGPASLAHTHFGAADPPDTRACVDGHFPSVPARQR